MEKIKIRDGIRMAMAVSADGNKFFQVWTCGDSTQAIHRKSKCLV